MIYILIEWTKAAVFKHNTWFMFVYITCVCEREYNTAKAIATVIHKICIHAQVWSVHKKSISSVDTIMKNRLAFTFFFFFIIFQHKIGNKRLYDKRNSRMTRKLNTSSAVVSKKNHCTMHLLYVGIQYNFFFYIYRHKLTVELWFFLLI